MSEQAKILEELQGLIMDILKTGSASAEQGKKLDELESLLHKQRSFKPSSNPTYESQGEEIAYMFLADSYKEAIDKLYEYKINSNDFFGFVEYHFDEDEEDEKEIIDIFSDTFREKINRDYELKCQAK